MNVIELALPCLLLNASPGDGIDAAFAKRVFQEARWASDDDGGAAWGKELYGPTLFFDPTTGAVVANQADAERLLTESDGVFVGKAAKDFAGANTALDWAGVHWTVVLWPLPERTFDRTRLILHESWHRVQSELGLPSASVRNEHLATRDGRIWLLMEYRALAKALPAWGPERRRALEDALAFRAYRRTLFPNAAAEEDRMEVHEGLAEYTGVACGGSSNDGARYYMAGRLKLAALKPSLSYAFAYETGPAYGLLLDMDGAAWRRALTPSSSLSAALAKANGIEVARPTLDDVVARAKAYDGDALIAAETQTDVERKTAEAKYRRELVTDPVLDLPWIHMNYVFDPNAVVPLSGEGTVYLGCKFIDDWGILTVDGAALVDPAFATVRVPAPKSAKELHGNGWSLELNPGWKLTPAERPRDFTASDR
ncbi:MAG: hypothetical protein K8S98_06370 [Planctomycetes bacterium]|nr:hypothetical protein [Planctomycetota bacterium]